MKSLHEFMMEEGKNRVEVSVRDARKADEIARDMFRGAYKQTGGSNVWEFKKKSDLEDFIIELENQGIEILDESTEVEIEKEELDEGISKSQMSKEVFTLNKDRVGQVAVSTAGKEVRNSLVISSNIIAVKESGKIRLHIVDPFDSNDKFEVTLFGDEMKVLKKFL